MSENFLYIFLLFLPFEFVGSTGSGECDPLIFDGLITCENSRNTPTVPNDCGESQPVGTRAKYKCKPHYSLLRHGDGIMNSENNNVLTCVENGSWIGYERFNSVICQEECGHRLTNPKPLIVNGMPTNSSTWPWHVALFRRRGLEFDYICGGTIISRSTILTVAHCVTDNNGQKLDPNSTLAVLGATTSNFTQNRLQLGSQILEVNKIYVSENYDVKKEYQADIAVLHLSKYIEYTDNVSPICLPNDFAVDTNTIRPGTLGDVVGFGIDETGEIAHNLKHGLLEIKSHTECFVSLDRILSESQFCAGSPTADVHMTVCNGDSGGGLIRPSPIDQKYYIHGLVSSGDPNPTKRICESHAVFTRVYSFIFWIRGILKDLKDNVLHLGSGNGFVYRQSGTEEEHGRFLSINQEWRNKVTAIELSYMDIDPEILLNSLHFSKRVQSINFTQCMFTGTFPEQRVLLPLLRTFSLDILRPDFVLSEESRFPITLSKEFLRSLVFFEKDFENGNLDIVKIPSLKTNMDITAHIFKLLRIHHEEGEFMISQIPFSNEILENISDDFRLRYLALSRINLSSSLLTRLTRIVESLVLDEVTGIEAQQFSQNLKTLTKLNEFVFISPKSNVFSKFQISLNSLPKSLKYLALTRAVLRIDPTHRQSYINILNDLDTFYCDSCLQYELLNSLQILSDIFPKLRRLVLNINSNSNISIITTALESFKNLEFALVKSGSGFINLLRKKNETWHVQSLQNTQEFLHFEFVFNRKKHFWSSEADYMVGKRVSSFENLGFKSRNYQFNGGFKVRRDFTVIPKQIQERLHTIQIGNTYLTSDVIGETLKYAKELRRLRITNVTLLEIFIDKLVEIPNLTEYTLEQDRTSWSKTFNFKKLATVLSIAFPNLIPFRQEPGINLKTNLLSSKLNKYHMTFGECIMVSWDKIEQSLISTLVYTNDWLKYTNDSIPIKKLVFQYWELDPTSLPSMITQLNLNFAIVKDVGMILRRLSQLSHLKLINVRVNDDGNFKDWDWTEIDMQDLSKHSNTLEYLAIEKAHLRNYSPGMTFDKVEFVYLESCTFEKSFVRNFMSTFPSLKRLVILGGSDPRFEIHLDVIILGALRSNTLEWILMSQPVVGSSNRARKEINGILDQNGINPSDDSKYYILERTSSSETWRRNISLDELMIESEMLELKGVTDIGINPQCHAYSYRIEKSPTVIPGQLFSVIYEDFLSTAT